MLLDHLQNDNAGHNLGKAGNLFFDEVASAVSLSANAIVDNPGRGGHYMSSSLPYCLSDSILTVDRFVMVCISGELALLTAVFRILKLLSRLISSRREILRLYAILKFSRLRRKIRSDCASLILNKILCELNRVRQNQRKYHGFKPNLIFNQLIDYISMTQHKTIQDDMLEVKIED